MTVAREPLPSGALPTAAAEWDAWPGLAALPPAAPPSTGGRLVVVSPHPDDETVGAGGTMAVLAAAGWAVTLVAVTDGEGSHPGSPTHPPAVLAARRRDETAAALAALGLDEVDVVRLGLPDRGVPERRRALAAALGESVRGAAWCLTTAPSDGHRDHVATAAATAAACTAQGVPLATFPVWTWLRSRPGEDPARWARARATALPEDVVRRKAAAVDSYASQLMPLSPHPADAAVLPHGFADHFRRPIEVLFVEETA